MTMLDRYAKLIFLRGEGFRCMRAARPGGSGFPRDERLRDATGRIQDAIRSELVRREGEERVAAVETADERGREGSWTSGSCSVTDADRARELYRRALFDLRDRLELPKNRSD